MADLELEYALPLSALHFTATVNVTKDSVRGGPPARVATGAVALSVVADRRRQCLKLDGGWLVATSAAFELTDDGRLTSADVTYTGQAGKVVLGAASLAANIAGLVAGVPGLGAFAVRSKAALEGEEVRPPEDPVAARYLRDHRPEALLRGRYERLVAVAVEGIAEGFETALRATGEAERSAALGHVRLLEQSLPSLRRELARLDAHFKAWRAATIEEWTEEHDEILTLDSLRAAGVEIRAGGDIAFSDEDAGREARRLWELTGLTVTLDPERTPNPLPESVGNDSVIVREPRVAVLSVYERTPDGKARLQRTVEQLVMDSACPFREVELDKSWFADRTGTLKFSALGGLVGITQKRTSAAAAVADTFADLPARISSGLDEAKKIRTTWGDLQSLQLDQQLARTKKEVELKQQQLAKAGLVATETDWAELERLKQRAEILAQRKAIGDASLDDSAREVTALKQQVEALKAQKDLAEATRTLAAEQELSGLRLEIERLEAEQARLKALLPPTRDGG